MIRRNRMMIRALLHNLYWNIRAFRRNGMRLADVIPDAWIDARMHPDDADCYLRIIDPYDPEICQN